mmetsp:Transcript_13399/g.20147  ORF Transcript_13399/g.20147 Transcript_13399/m.20147 type:complete len:898 (-) Transcript_13399:183-2876(-)|eukprot:CAMPEP_0185031662 /NCGR_PEP_ID=MMETSP1103-20130426/19254_1 /TAXON_ID=36769 /ORGANISM="Paraphysomonas bandaiensis, Strain Caron Lab Isolate" /LENGTH=897 /DNA_ID=CAMNT_0027567255 /DNA_START=84 /DNA_END=2777 /DNA_ORIENTATION=-
MTAPMTPELELFETEDSYVKSLKYIISVYLEPLEVWIQQMDKEFDRGIGRDRGQLYIAMKKDNINITNVLFSNIRQLLGVNEFILSEIKAAGSSRIDIVKRFCRVAPSLIMYNDYIRNCDNARELLTRLKNDNRFANFLRDIDSNPDNRGLTLEQYLAKPWQRVMKYELLFREIKKRSTDNEEIEQLTRTISSIQSIIGSLNSSQSASESRKLLLEKQKYYGLKDLSQPARYFVRDGTLKRVNGPHRKKEYSFILCSDALFYGRKQSTLSSAKFKSFDVHTIQVFRHTTGTSRFFTLRLSDTDAFQVEAPSVQDCDQWIESFTAVMADESLEQMTGRKDVRRLTSRCREDIQSAEQSREVFMKVWEYGLDGKGCKINTYMLPDSSNGVNPHDMLLPAENTLRCSSADDIVISRTRTLSDDEDTSSISSSCVDETDMPIEGLQLHEDAADALTREDSDHESTLGSTNSATPIDEKNRKLLLIHSFKKEWSLSVPDSDSDMNDDNTSKDDAPCFPNSPDCSVTNGDEQCSISYESGGNILSGTSDQESEYPVNTSSEGLVPSHVEPEGEAAVQIEGGIEVAGPTTRAKEASVQFSENGKESNGCMDGESAKRELEEASSLKVNGDIAILRWKSFFVYDCRSHNMSTYFFRLTAPFTGTVSLDMHQSSTPFIDIGLSVLHECDEADEIRWERVCYSPCCVRDTVALQLNLTAGHNYLIIPCTTGSEFSRLKVSNARSNRALLTTDNDGRIVFTATAKLCLEEIFDRMNMDMNCHLSKNEIKRYISVTQPSLTGPEATKKAKHILRNFDTGPDGLSLTGFFDALLSTKSYGFRPSLTMRQREIAMRQDILSFGYDENFRLTGSRGCVLSAQASSTGMSIKIMSFKPDLYKLAIGANSSNVR